MKLETVLTLTKEEADTLYSIANRFLEMSVEHYIKDAFPKESALAKKLTEKL